MIYVAKIEGGRVVQVIVAPADYLAAEGWVVIGPENVVGMGWAYDRGQFIAPIDPADLAEGP